MKKNLVIFGIILVLLIGLLSWRHFSNKQPKVFTVGVLNYTKAAEPTLDGFKKGMEDWGYREGDKIHYIYNGPFRDKDQLIQEGKKLLEQKVDLIFAMSTPASLVAKSITKGSQIPIVFGPVNDAVGSGLVSGLKNHESNITGIMFGVQEEKRLEWMTKLVPGLKRVFVPYNPDDKSPRVSIQKLKKVVEPLDLEIVLREVRNSQDLEVVLKSLPTDVDGIFLPTDSFMAEKTPEFAKAAIPLKLPVSCPHRPGVVKGALFSYGFDQFEVGVQASRLADQIFKGISPRDLPVEIAELFLSININTAESIGLEIPEDTLSQAIIIGR